MVNLTEKELVIAINDIINYCKNDTCKNLKESLSVLETFLEIKKKGKGIDEQRG